MGKMSIKGVKRKEIKTGGKHKHKPTQGDLNLAKHPENLGKNLEKLLLEDKKEPLVSSSYLISLCVFGI